MTNIQAIESFLGQKKGDPLFEKGLSIYLASEVILIHFDLEHQHAICQTRDPSEGRPIYQTHLTGLQNRRDLKASCECDFTESHWCEHAYAALMKVAEHARLASLQPLPESVVGHFNPLAYKEQFLQNGAGAAQNGATKDQAADTLALPPASSLPMPSSD